MSRVTEAEVAVAVEKVLIASATGRATFRELIEKVPQYLTLSAEDLMPSSTRPGEALWEQQVRNITSHKNSPGNAIYEGRLVVIPGGRAGSANSDSSLSGFPA